MISLVKSFGSTSLLSKRKKPRDDETYGSQSLGKKLVNLERQIDQVLFHFGTVNTKSQFISQLQDIKASVLATIPRTEQIHKLAVQFSLDPQKPVNGYAMLINFYGGAVDRASAVIGELHSKRSSLRLQFSTSYWLKNLKAWAQLIHYLNDVVTVFVDVLAKHSEDDDIFVDVTKLSDDELQKIKDVMFGVNLFGRTLGFQYDNSHIYSTTAYAVALASFDDLTSLAVGSVMKTAASVFYAPKYIVNPELRSEKIAQINRNAKISFCRSFWRVTETDIYHLNVMLSHNDVLINVNFDVSMSDDEKGDKTSVKLMSYKLFEGMQEIPEIRRLYGNFPQGKKILPPSNVLLFHIHGGAFISMSPRSHEIYLRPWARRLKVPILSVDYALCPENPFPVPLNDCIRAYNWALENKSKLGWNGKKIVIVGDSAGGSLATALSCNQIMKNLRVPDGLFLFFPVLSLEFRACPSRILSSLDIYVNCEMSLRYIAAYLGIPEKSTHENRKSRHPRRISTPSEKQPFKYTDYLYEAIRNSGDLLKNPLLSPMSADDNILKQLPETHIWCGTCDPMVDDCVQMARRLKKLDVPCYFRHLEGVQHGFLNMHSSKISLEAFQKVTNDMQKLLSQSGRI